MSKRETAEHDDDKLTEKDLDKVVGGTPGSGRGNAYGHSDPNNQGDHTGLGLAGAHSHGPTCPPNCGF